MINKYLNIRTPVSIINYSEKKIDSISNCYLLERRPVNENCQLILIGHMWKVGVCVCVCVWPRGLLFSLYPTFSLCMDRKFRPTSVQIMNARLLSSRTLTLSMKAVRADCPKGSQRAVVLLILLIEESCQWFKRFHLW